MAGAAPTLAALLKALRRAETAAAAETAMEQAVDRLIASTSLAESQQLVLGLQVCARDHHSSPFTASLYGKVQQAAAICSEPPAKAQYLGFVLLQAGVHLLGTLEVSTQRQVLLKVFNANNGALSGYVAALTAADGPFFSYEVDHTRAKRTLEIVSPVFKSVLMDTTQSEGHKTLVLDALSRIAWRFGGQSEDNEALRTAVVRLLVQALELVPYSQLSQASYVVHVALTVDLLSSLAAHSKEQVALAQRTARFVLEASQILISKGEGVLALLQSLEQLAQAVPEALWCSVFLVSIAYFMVDSCL
ncbi:Armadillo-type fold [Phytophthora cinnamomi]|uniref:Armadillo-type fold n=1 Tax=Phytophthora cinnamomi TaxID=4785 RepID=UPI00355AA976|nr:Armadillo-type fold [Phytophthora cinnamomi]